MSVRNDHARRIQYDEALRRLSARYTPRWWQVFKYGRLWVAECNDGRTIWGATRAEVCCALGGDKFTVLNQTEV